MEHIYCLAKRLQFIQVSDFPCTFFNPAQSPARLCFDDQGLVIHTGERIVQWPINKVTLEFGGANHHLVYLRYEEREEGVFLEKTADFLFQLNSVEEFKVQLKKLQSRFRIGSWGLYGALLLASALLVGALVYRSAILSPVVNLIPYAFDQMIGRQSLPFILNGQQTINDELLNAELKKLLEPLLSAVPTPYRDVEIFVVRAKTLNAFALPGGMIVFHSQTILAVDDPDEILGVAAHEIAHVQLRHTTRNLLQSIGLFSLVQVLIGDYAGFLAVLADQSQFLLSQGFSRADEREADEQGFQTLVKAKINPRGMVAFFERLRATQDPRIKRYEKTLEFMSTHPDTDERIKSLHEKYSALDLLEKDSFRKNSYDIGKLKMLLGKGE